MWILMERSVPGAAGRAALLAGPRAAGSPAAGPRPKSSGAEGKRLQEAKLSC